MINGTLGLTNSLKLALNHFCTPAKLLPLSVRSPQATPVDIVLREGFTVALRGSRGLSVPDIGILYEVLAEDHYQLERFLSTGDLVIEVGAHIGIFSLLAAQHVGPKGRVISFEPSAENFALLQRNCCLNPDLPIEPHNYAIAGMAGPRFLAFSANNTGGHSLLSSMDNGQAVAALTLTDVMERFEQTRINLLKLDCEGSEYEIIASASTTLLERIDRILMELHETEYTPPKASKALKNRLEDSGFVLTTLSKVCYPSEGYFELLVGERK